MGKIKIANEARLERLKKYLRNKGFLVKRQLPDGSYVIYKRQKVRDKRQKEVDS